MTAASLDRADLADALAWVAKAVPTRPATPVLAGIRLTFDDNGVTCTGFDYEASHQAVVPGIVTAHGEVLVPGHLAASMVAALKGDTVRLDPGDTGWGLKVGAGRAVFHLPELPLTEYPSLPDQPPSVGRIPAGQLQGVVRVAYGGAGRDDMLPALTGIRLVGIQDDLLAEATDRFRVHRATCRWQPTEEFKAIVPGGRLRAAVDGLRGLVDVGHRDTQLRLATDTRVVTLRLLEVEFPKLDSHFPDIDDCPITVDVDVDDLRGAVTRAELALERNTAAHIVVTPDGVEVRADLQPGAATGAATDALDAHVRGVAAGKTYETGYNPRFLRDSLDALATRRAVIGWRENTRLPALLIAHDPDLPADQVPDHQVVLMPRRATNA